MHLRRLLGLLEEGSARACVVERVGAALQLGPTALYDFLRAGREASEEGIDVSTDVVRGAEAGIGSHLAAHPGPDVLIGF